MLTAFDLKPVEKTPADRLLDLLHEWGDWTRRFKGTEDLDCSRQDFIQSERRYVEADELFAGADRDRMLLVDAVIESLHEAGRPMSPRWLVLHFHFAQGLGNGAAVWRNRRLPEPGTGPYRDLLAEAVEAVKVGLGKRDGRHLYDY